MADVFISYSRADRTFVRRLHDALSDRGKDVWMDERDIAPSADWLAEIFAGIEGSDDVVFVVSPDSIASEVCATEVDHAEKHRKRIVPVVYRELDGQAAPHAIASRNWIFFRTGDDFPRALDTLVHALETDLDRVHAHTRLLVRAREWEDSARNPSLLLTGSELRAAETLVTAPSDGGEATATPLQHEYVLASRHRATRRTQTLLGAVVLALLVTLALAALAWQQRGQARHQTRIAKQQARIALSRALATTAGSRLDSQVDLAALLALEAYRQAPTDEVRAVLVRTIERGTRIGPLATLPGAASSLPVAFSPTSDLVAATDGSRGNVLVWDLRTRRVVSTLKNADSQQVSIIAFSPDGRLIATGGLDGQAALWQAESGKLVGRPFGPPGDANAYITGLAFARHGQMLAVSNRYGGVGLWRVRDHHELAEPDAAPSGYAVGSLAASPDGGTIAAGSRGGVAFVDAATRRVLKTRVPLPGEVGAVAYSRDGSRFAAGNAGGIVKLWDARDGRPTGRPIVLPGVRGGVTGLAFTPDGSTLLTVSRLGKLQFWDTRKGRPLGDALETHMGRADGIAVSRHGSLLAISGDEPLALWNLGVRPTRLAAQPATWVDDASTLVLAPHGDLALAVDQAGGTAALWRFPKAGQQPRHLLTSGAWDGRAFDPAEKLVAVGLADGRVGLWKVGGGGPSWLDTKQPKDQIEKLAFSPDGRYLAASSATANRLSVFAVAGRRLVAQWVPPQSGELAFTPDDLLAVGAANTVTFWDPSKGTPSGRPLTLAGGDVSALAVSPKGIVAAAGGDGTIRLGDVRSRKPVGAVLSGHRSFVRDVAFSVDGATLASTSGDGTVRLWAVPSGAPLGGVLRVGSPRGKRDTWTVRFTSDGKRLVWVSSTDIETKDFGGSFVYFASDGNRALWAVDPRELERELCALARRNLTRAEWTAFLPGVPYHATCRLPASVS